MTSAEAERIYTEALANETRDALTQPEHQSNVFSAWSDGFSAGLADLDTATHRAYQRGLRDAKREAFLARWVFAAAAFVGGVLVGIASFA